MLALIYHGSHDVRVEAIEIMLLISNWRMR